MLCNVSDSGVFFASSALALTTPEIGPLVDSFRIYDPRLCMYPQRLTTAVHTFQSTLTAYGDSDTLGRFATWSPSLVGALLFRLWEWLSS